MKRLVWLVLFLAVTGCSKGAPDAGIASRPEVAAASKIAQSFAVVADDSRPPSPLTFSTTPGNKLQLSIKKSALEKEFLLQASMTQYGSTPQWGGLKSRIVAFRERDGALYLLEATQGHTVTTDVPVTLLLAQFPVIGETADQVTFDFNAGMSNIFATSDWYAADEESGRYSPDYSAQKTRFSYLDAVRLNDRNQLEITQQAQLAGTNRDGSADNSSVQVKYYLSPYNPSPDFTPVVSRNQDVAGYFAVAPVLQGDGSSVVRSAHFNINKPIVFAVSGNTPAEFKQAVREGILSWNKYLGEGRMQVVDAPDGVTAPDLNANVVQWVHDDISGAAYADAQMDPRSGEVLHAQVYMPSAFAALGKNRLRTLLARKPQAGNRGTAKKQRLSLVGFQSAHLCDYELGDALAAAAETVAAVADAPDADAKALKAAQDYVRGIVAHEIGHTLGLRHNFAGSTAVNYPLAQRRANVSAYIETGAAPAGTITTSSIMDYDPFEEEVILGDQLAHGTQILEYDRKALEMLYLGKAYSSSDVPLFCTDGNADSQYADCQRFDTGASAVEYHAWSDESAAAALPFTLIEKFVRFAKSPRTGDIAVPVEKVILDPDFIARSLFSGRRQVYGMLGTGSYLFRVRQLYPFVSSLNAEEIRKAELTVAAADLAKFGGLEKVFGSLPEDFSAKAFAKFCELLDSGQYSGGTGPNGSAYAFTTTEIATMKAQARLLFSKFPVSVAKAELWALSGGSPVLPTKKSPDLSSKLEDGDLGYDLATLLAKKFAQYGLAVEQGRDLVATVQIPDPDVKADAKADPAVAASTTKPLKSVALALPVFTYPIEVRVAAAGLLKTERSLAPDWAVIERASAKKSYTELVKKSLGGYGPKAFPAAQMPRAVERWLVEAVEAGEPASLLE